MAGLVNIGFGNLIHADRLLAVVNPDAAPVRRLVSAARENGKCIDATQGRKTKSVLVMDTNEIVLSALTSDTIARRFGQLPVTEGGEIG